MAIIKQFPSVAKWADTCELVVHTEGPEEVDRRTKSLPPQFRKELIKELEERAFERDYG